MRIIHARVFPMDAPVIEDGYVDMRDGRIAAIGLMADKPRDGSEELDAGGGWLLPGLIDAHSHIGMWGRQKLTGKAGYKSFAHKAG